MNEEDVYAALAPIFAGIFGRDIALSPGLAARDVAGWDSFRQVEILIAAEARFGLKFTSAEIDRMRCLGDLVSIVACACRSGGGAYVREEAPRTPS